ncbi:MAG: carboxypeptidase regulatory-like domain-containing protein, partial [Leptospirales bacterium]|nr:carboxypeptidase regulatory-like domain-containing protein [Leptospirales bacterium]
QDWSYRKTGCLDLTIEVSNRNPTSEAGVEEVFLYNRDSLMALIDKADQGIYGRVTNSSGKPISGVEIETSWDSISGDVTGDIVIRTDINGYYNRILFPGIYNLTFTKSGYTTEVVYNISVTDRTDVDTIELK